MGLLWDHFGIIMESLRDHFGIIMGSLWDHFGIILGPGGFGVIMGSLGKGRKRNPAGGVRGSWVRPYADPPPPGRRKTIPLGGGMGSGPE